MNMTHYMELLADNQPWNLLLFMAIPVVLAETMAITELYILFTRKLGGTIHQINRVAGISVGLYFMGVIVYLTTTAVIPITQSGSWRTIIDVVAVGAYLVGGIPLVLIAALLACSSMPLLAQGVRVKLPAWPDQIGRAHV